MLRLERRKSAPAYLYVLVPATAVILALLFGAVFLLVNGFNPWFSYIEMAKASLATRYGFEDSLVSATPLIFTGVAASISFRFKLYNIGAEGQLITGGICAAAAGLTMGDALPAPLSILTIIVAGAAGGMLWILLPAITRSHLGVNEIITTLLLNYVAVLLARYLIFGSRSPVRDPTSTNFPQGRLLPEATFFPHLPSSPVHMGLVLGVVCAVLVFALLRWTRIGFEARVFGDAPAAARYAGINVAAVILTVLLLSGALAGLAGASEVAGRAHRLDPTGLAVGFGYTGIIVAALARYHPLAVVPVAVLVGGLANAANSLQTIPGMSLPSSISAVLQGAVLIFVLGAEIFLTYRPVWRRGAGTLQSREASHE
jgi:simple sugar transport system permease protein